MSAPRLEASIRRNLGPPLRADEYRGSGRTFRRVIGDWIQVVNVQGSRHGGKFAVNLAVHPIRIPDVLGNAPDPESITESLCEFRGRLSVSGSDQWWSFEPTQESMDAAVAAAAVVYVTRGRPVLAALAAAESPLGKVTALHLESGNFNFLGLGSTFVRMCLALGRLRSAQGQVRESHEFARLGLSRLGRATLLKEAFVELLGDET